MALKLGSGHVGNKHARGYLNNNPLNLRYSPLNRWVGLLGSDSKNFCRFATVQHGLRASMINLRTYFNRWGLNTIYGIIHKWAPVADGNFYNANYISYVARRLGVSEHTPLTFERSTVLKLVAAMSVFESAYEPTVLELDSAFAMI